MANLTLGDFYNAIREGAREATLEALAEVDFSTSSKQDTIKGVLDLLATEATLDDVKTATEALAALIDSGALKTTLTGSLPPSSMEIYGASLDDRPEADTVPIGAAFVLIDTLDVWMSDGTSWLEVS